MQEEEPEEDAVGIGSTPATPDAISSDDMAVNGSCQSTNEGITAVFGVTAAIIGLVPLLIKSLRYLIYFFINAGLKFSDTLEVQANLIEMNAYNLQMSEYVDDGFDDKKRSTIVKKQLKVANNLKKWANKIAMVFNKSNKKTRDRVDKEDKTKYTVDDLKNDLPADIYNKSVLF